MSAGAAASERCPRCGGGFHCGVQDASPCPCSGLKLSASLRDNLRQRYTGCLCLACLQTLAGDPDQSLRSTTLPTE